MEYSLQEDQKYKVSTVYIKTKLWNPPELRKTISIFVNGGNLETDRIFPSGTKVRHIAGDNLNRTAEDKEKAGA
jgi:hypothetical protein